MPEQTDKKFLQPHELARVLNVSLGWVYTHSSPNAKRRLPTKRVGGLLRFDLSEVMAWLDQQDSQSGKRKERSDC